MSNIDVAAIAEAQAELDRLDTEISEAIKQIEVLLHKHVSIRVGTPTPWGDLFFGKFGGAWRLILAVDQDDMFPLVSAPRDVRALVFSEGHVATLIASIAANLRSEQSRRAAALAASDEIIRVLKDGGC